MVSKLKNQSSSYGVFQLLQNPIRWLVVDFKNIKPDSWLRYTISPLQVDYVAESSLRLLWSTIDHWETIVNTVNYQGS